MNKLFFQISSVKKIAFLIFFYSLIYVCYTYPAITDFSTRLIGKNDAYVVLWNTYIFETGIHSGKIWTTQQSFYPWGTSLIYHGSTPFLGLISMMFENKILLFNIFIYFMFVASALGAYWLTKQFVVNNYFAIICGFIFAFSPYKMARIEEHYPLVFTALIPIFFVIFMRTFSFEAFHFYPKIQSKKYFSLLIATGILGFIIDYTIFFQMGYICVLFLLFFYVFYLYQASKKWIFWIGIFMFFIAMHFIISWLVFHGVDDKGGLWWGGKWLDFITPYNSRLFTKTCSNQIESDMFLGYSFIISLGLSLFSLSFIKHIDSKIKALLFSLFMLFLIVMPVILLPIISPLYPPTAIIQFLPVIKNLRCPTRFVNDIMLIAPIIIFYGIEKSSFLHRDKMVVATMIFVLLFAEYFPTKYSYIDYHSVPIVYSELAKKTGESVLVYPLGLRDGMKLEGRFDIETMQYQTVYKKKTMGGYISRLDDWIWYVHYQNAFTNTLLQLEKDSLFVIKPNNYAAAFQTLKLDYVVIPRRYRCEKAALFLQNTCSPFVVQKEEFNGDLLLSLKR